MRRADAYALKFKGMNKAAAAQNFCNLYSLFR